MFMPNAIRQMCKTVSLYKYTEVYKYSSICALLLYSNFFPESDKIKYLVIGYLLYRYSHWLSPIMSSTNGKVKEKRSINSVHNRREWYVSKTTTIGFMRTLMHIQNCIQREFGSNSSRDTCYPLWIFPWFFHPQEVLPKAFHFSSLNICLCLMWLVL
jgi:hypothetical protein